MNNQPPVIAVEHLSVERDVCILNDITWRVFPGENWVILGQNGAGKTTLLQTLTAYVSPSRGTIRVCGKIYGQYNWPQLRRRIGLVSSNLTGQIRSGETVLETIVSGKYATINSFGPMSASDRNAAGHILDVVECSRLADRKWGQISQGEKQRVLIARALMADLALLILDEPCAGLDPAARERFLLFLDRFSSGNSSPAVILVTHHVEEITPAFTHVLVLKNGSILAAGPLRRVMSSPLLADAFNARVILRRSNDRYTLQVTPVHTMEL